MYISPIHNTNDLPDKPVKEWDTDLMVEIFFAQVNGWHLEIADRCINGWKDEFEQDYIKGKHRDGSDANYIADSGWAVLQIVLNYFETIGFATLGKNNKSNKHLFCRGFFDTFPEFSNFSKPEKTKIINLLWKGLRVWLYHGDNINIKENNQIRLRHATDSQPLDIKLESGTLIIDPHLFVQKLKNHLKLFCHDLSNIENTEKREKFRQSFIAKYGDDESNN